jgi:transcription elongation factor Elf1
MRLEEAINQIEHNLEGDLKKRFACAHCGKTWVEIVGVFTGNIDGQEDVYIRIGEESTVCQNCKFRIRQCPACGSSDAYEINFPLNNTQKTPLSFNRICIVRKT